MIEFHVSFSFAQLRLFCELILGNPCFSILGTPYERRVVVVYEFARNIHL